MNLNFAKTSNSNVQKSLNHHKVSENQHALGQDPLWLIGNLMQFYHNQLCTFKQMLPSFFS